MSHEEAWLAKWRETMEFIEKKRRNPSKHRVEEHMLVNWVKHNRKLMNAGKLKETRQALFTKLLAREEGHTSSRYLTHDVQHVVAKRPRLLSRHAVGIVLHAFSMSATVSKRRMSSSRLSESTFQTASSESTPRLRSCGSRPASSLFTFTHNTIDDVHIPFIIFVVRLTTNRLPQQRHNFQGIIDRRMLLQLAEST